ncbi:hypothetical protein BH09PLA1_BH09PLA1_13600 [soil metagenome]
MWGNLAGWMISVLLVLGAVGGAAYLDRMDRVTSATAFGGNIATFGSLDLPIELQPLMPDLSGPVDATPALSTAINAYRADFYTYDRAAAGHVPDHFDALPAIAPIVEVAMSPGAALLSPMKEQAVTYKARRPELDAVRVLGEALVRAALAREASDPAAAIGYYNAALALGMKLYRERLTYAEFSAGLSLMSQAAQQLAKLTSDPKRAEALRAFEPARRDFIEQRVNPVWRILGSVDPNIVQTHAGDTFVIARDAPERMWRVEAIFALGRYKFSAQRFRDRANATRTLEELAESEADPIVKQAAIAARDMTIEDFRMLH